MMKQHRLWILSFLCGVGLLTGLIPLDQYLQQTAQTHLKALQTQKQNRETQIKQWETDALMATEINDEEEIRRIKRYLLPANRTAMAERIELLAAAAMLYDFKYTLSPSKKWNGNSSYPNFWDVTESMLEFQAAAPHEESLFRFIGSLAGDNSHVILQNIKIEKIKSKKPALRNVTLSGQIKWLMNGKQKDQK